MITKKEISRNNKNCDDLNQKKEFFNLNKTKELYTLPNINEIVGISI